MSYRSIVSLLIFFCIVLPGCGGKFTPTVESPKENLVDHGVMINAAPKTFVNITLPDQRTMLRPVRDVNLQQVALINAIHQALPSVKVIPLDHDVDLAQGVSVYTNAMTTKEFIEQLRGITDYHFEMRDNSLRIASIASKRWDLSTYATKRNVSAVVGQSIVNSDDSGNSGGTDQAQDNTRTSQTLLFDEDSWTSLLSGAQRILGIDEQGSGQQLQSGTQIATQLEQRVRSKAYVVGSRQMGIIEAAGSPSKMAKLDAWFSELVARSDILINLDVRYYEVQLNDERGSGIDWTALFTGTRDGQPATLDLQSATPGFFENSGIFSIGGAIDAVDFDAEFFLRFLQNYGKVQLLQQPNVTVVNGTPAYIASGEEFSFQSSFEQSQDAQGQVVVTPILTRLKVGVTLSVTARKMEGDKILIDIVPVITSLLGFDELDAGVAQLRTPNIALDELATQVITRSGKSVRLGGLISESISEQVKKIPREGDKNNYFYDWIFKSQLNNIERKELVISITPRIIGT